MSAEPGQDAAAAGAAPKQDPESLVLRGRPRPVVRFRRGLIMAIAAGTALTVSTVTFVALKPAGLRLAASAGERDAFGSGRTPDALAGAPANYGDVPRLGPPLPGDLGRPILEHDRALAEQPAAVPRDPPLDVAERARAAAETERVAARSSAVLVQLSRRPGEAAAIEAAAKSQEGASAGNSAAGAATGKADFARAGSGSRNPDGLAAAPSPWMLTAGTIIPASLVTGLNSDLPGMVVAQVTQGVRDSATGQAILIPQGARLIGQYDSAVAYGQRRALLIWQRIIFPDGSSIGLDHMPAADAGGYAGVEDRVDFHTLRLIEGVALASLLGAGAELVRQGERGGLIGALRDSVQDNGGKAGDELAKRNLEVQPTLRVRPGWPIRAIVNKDLILAPWKEK